MGIISNVVTCTYGTVMNSPFPLPIRVLIHAWVRSSWINGSISTLEVWSFLTWWQRHKEPLISLLTLSRSSSEDCGRFAWVFWQFVPTSLLFWLSELLTVLESTWFCIIAHHAGFVLCITRLDLLVYVLLNQFRYLILFVFMNPILIK